VQLLKRRCWFTVVGEAVLVYVFGEAVLLFSGSQQANKAWLSQECRTRQFGLVGTDGGVAG
jgi:hypothetical protein